MFEVMLYKTEDGKEPVADFIDSLDNKMAAKVVGLLDVLEEKGNELREPFTEYLRDGIFALRCKQGSNITRFLFFFYYDKRIVLTNGFVKKDQKIDPRQIELAIKRRKDWIERFGTTDSEVIS